MFDYALQVENLSYEYMDKNKALSGISFEIEKGHKVFFHGANGAGKTTLFQCLTGLLKVKQGKILLGGKVTEKEKDRMKKISIVFQNADDQIIAGSVFDEVAFGPLNMGLRDSEVILRVEEAMRTMNIFNLKDKPPHFLSYGQKKRVTIASILAMNQDIIILDEPTAGLDAKQSEELIGILNGLAKKGTTLMISTHDAEFSYRCADKIIVLDSGELIAKGNVYEVFSNTEMLKKTGIQKPLIMEIYGELVENGLVEHGSVFPKDREGLRARIKEIGHER